MLNFRLLTVSCIFVILGCHADVVPADEVITWQRVYRADVLPDDDGSIVGPDGFRGQFQLNTDGQPPPVRITEAKTLLYRDEESNQRRYIVGTMGSADGTTAWNAVQGPGTTVEIRLRVLVGAGPGGTAGGLRIGTGRDVYFARVRTDGIEGLNRAHDALGFDFHGGFVTLRYVVPVDGGPGTVQFVDAQGRTGEAELHPQDVDQDNSLSFSGGGQGDPPKHLEWEVESIRWTHSGAFPWDPEQVSQAARLAMAERKGRADQERRAAMLSVEPIQLNNFRQLFIDDYLIEERHAVRRNVHQAEKHPANPVLTGEAPWEGPHGETGGFVLLFGSVERNPESSQLRMWYMTAYEAQPPGPKYHMIQCVVESEDGVRWQRPVVGLVPFNGGSKENNIVFSTATHSGYDECLTPIRDPDPDDPSQRYRSLFWASHNGFRGTYSAWSPDGLNWTSGAQPVFTDTGDAGSLMYDTIRNRWIFFARPLDNQLSRAVSFSEDFQTWTPLRVIFQADQGRREDFYNMTGFCYQGIYVGLVVVMWEEPDRYALEPHLVMSRDGENWSWVGRQNAFIPHGPRGSFDEFNTQMGAGEPVRVDDKLHFYFSGRTYPHNPYYFRDQPELVPKKVLKSEIAIGLATLRVDGFASLEDHWRGGWVMTKPFVCDGETLHVNVDSEYGELRVELVDHGGDPIPGFTAEDCLPISADSVDATVRWQNGVSLSGLTGQPIRLKFFLDKTRLYSFWVD